jgi:3-dehydroquinate synthase
MNELTVQLEGRSYGIVFSPSFSPLAKLLKPFVSGRTCALISNPTVFPLYGELVISAVSAAGGSPVSILMPDGEEYKNLTEVEKILNQLAAHNLTRKCVVIALGGGVIGDSAGFVAATYMRGVPFIQVPTTLLAQVDSSVGGKTGVNLSAGKNLVGTFYQPRLVFINCNTLLSLDIRNCRAGYAEVIKYGMIYDTSLFEQLENCSSSLFAELAADSACIPDILGDIIKRCCEIKAGVVAQDERESGLRAILNYGHTFGHVVENLTGYTTYVHGEAVAIGMHAAAVFANKLGMCDEALVTRQKSLLQAAGLPVQFPALDTDAVIASFYHDKKSSAGSLRFVLPTAIGQVEIVDDPDLDLLKKTLDECQETSDM